MINIKEITVLEGTIQGTEALSIKEIEQLYHQVMWEIGKGTDIREVYNAFDIDYRKSSGIGYSSNVSVLVTLPAPKHIGGRWFDEKGLRDLVMESLHYLQVKTDAYRLYLQFKGIEQEGK